MSFAEFVEIWTGRDLDYHEKAQTTGFIFAEACWNAAIECAAAEAEDVAPGRDAEAIAGAILRMRSNDDVTGLAPEFETQDVELRSERLEPLFGVTAIESATHDAVVRVLDEAGIRNEVLRGMCIEVAIEKLRDVLRPNVEFCESQAFSASAETTCCVNNLLISKVQSLGK